MTIGDSVCLANQYERIVNTGLQKRTGHKLASAGSIYEMCGTTTATIATLSRLKNDCYPTHQVLKPMNLGGYDPTNIRVHRNAVILLRLSSILTSRLIRKADIYFHLYAKQE